METLTESNSYMRSNCNASMLRCRVRCRSLPGVRRPPAPRTPRTRSAPCGPGATTRIRSAPCGPGATLAQIRRVSPGARKLPLVRQRGPGATTRIGSAPCGPGALAGDRPLGDEGFDVGVGRGAVEHDAPVAQRHDALGRADRRQLVGRDHAAWRRRGAPGGTARAAPSRPSRSRPTNGSSTSSSSNGRTKASAIAAFWRRPRLNVDRQVVGAGRSTRRGPAGRWRAPPTRRSRAGGRCTRGAPRR